MSNLARAVRSDYAAERMAAELRAIRNLPRAALMARWTAAYGRPPPKGLSRRLLEHAAAYHLQVKAFGGHQAGRPPQAARGRRPDARHGGGHRHRLPCRRALAPGSRLVREWRGRSHTVEVLDQGFLCDGRHYASLSEIARTITGTRWSGPRFFGL
jgi:hypothetical protein